MDRRVCRPTRQGWDFDPGGQQLPDDDDDDDDDEFICPM
jgi:hypothetical protein